MSNYKRFNFTLKTNSIGETNLVPYLPLKISYQNYSLNSEGL